MTFKARKTYTRRRQSLCSRISATKNNRRISIHFWLFSFAYHVCVCAWTRDDGLDERQVMEDVTTTTMNVARRVGLVIGWTNACSTVVRMQQGSGG